VPGARERECGGEACEPAADDGNVDRQLRLRVRALALHGRGGRKGTGPVRPISDARTAVRRSERGHELPHVARTHRAAIDDRRPTASSRRPCSSLRSEAARSHHPMTIRECACQAHSTADPASRCSVQTRLSSDNSTASKNDMGASPQDVPPPPKGDQTAHEACTQDGPLADRKQAGRKTRDWRRCASDAAPLACATTCRVPCLPMRRTETGTPFVLSANASASAAACQHPLRRIRHECQHA
jgi:hypothetical protein